MNELLEIDQTVARNLKAIMAEKGFSSEATFAKATGKSQKTINNLLNVRYAVKLDTLCEIAHSVKIPPLSLLMDMSEPSMKDFQAIGSLISIIGTLSNSDRAMIAGVVERLQNKETSKD